MSLSNPSENLRNPAKKFIEFSGKTGDFFFYDKEKKEKIKIEKPITFTVLDEVSAITGFSDEHQCSIYSNEVKDMRSERLSVKYSKGGEITNGLYAEIKDKAKSAGGKYTKSIYAYFNNEIVNIKLTGAALSAWIEKKSDPSQGSIKVSECSSGKKGAVEYLMPIFEQVDFSEKDAAIEADKLLQKYLNQRIVKTEPTLNSEEVKQDLEEPLPEPPKEEPKIIGHDGEELF